MPGPRHQPEYALSRLVTRGVCLLERPQYASLPLSCEHECDLTPLRLPVRSLRKCGSGISRRPGAGIGASIQAPHASEPQFAERTSGWRQCAVSVKGISQGEAPGINQCEARIELAARDFLSVLYQLATSAQSGANPR